MEQELKLVALQAIGFIDLNQDCAPTGPAASYVTVAHLPNLPPRYTPLPLTTALPSSLSIPPIRRAHTIACIIP